MYELVGCVMHLFWFFFYILMHITHTVFIIDIYLKIAK